MWLQNTEQINVKTIAIVPHCSLCNTHSLHRVAVTSRFQIPQRSFLLLPQLWVGLVRGQTHEGIFTTMLAALAINLWWGEVRKLIEQQWVRRIDCAEKCCWTDWLMIVPAGTQWDDSHMNPRSREAAQLSGFAFCYEENLKQFWFLSRGAVDRHSLITDLHQLTTRKHKGSSALLLLCSKYEMAVVGNYKKIYIIYRVSWLHHIFLQFSPEKKRYINWVQNSTVSLLIPQLPCKVKGTELLGNFSEGTFTPTLFGFRLNQKKSGPFELVWIQTNTLRWKANSWSQLICFQTNYSVAGLMCVNDHNVVSTTF